MIMYVCAHIMQLSALAPTIQLSGRLLVGASWQGNSACDPVSMPEHHHRRHVLRPAVKVNFQLWPHGDSGNVKSTVDGINIRASLSPCRFTLR